MPLCRYCGKPTKSILSLAHPECVETFKKGERQARDLLAKAFESFDLEKLSIAQQVAQQALVGEKGFSHLISQFLPKAIERALEDHLLTDDEATFLHKANQLLTKEDARKISSALDQLNKATILLYLNRGNIPTVSIQGSLPFLLQKEERPIWVEENIGLYEYKSEKEYLSSGTGVSVRIAKGVYIRSSQYRTRQVITKERLHLVDKGILLITDKHFYFGGTKKIRRFSLHKIIGLRLYKDAVELHLDGTKPQVWIVTTNDPKFLANLINFLQ